jgi:toxin ParE1/3/4
MKVVWLRTALRNLDQTAAYIARDNPGAAMRVVERLRQATDRLARHPESGRPGRVADTRELIVPGLPFILPYRVRRNRIEILRVLHASRRWPRRLP